MSSMELVLLCSLCLHCNQSLPLSDSSPHDSIIPPWCGFSNPSHPFFSLLLPPSIHPSNHLFVLPCFHEAYALRRSPLCGLTTQRLAANDLALPQRLRSKMSLSHEIYNLTHKQMGTPQRHVHTHHTATYVHCIVCPSTHPHTFHMLLTQDELIFIYSHLLPPAAGAVVVI